MMLSSKCWTCHPTKKGLEIRYIFLCAMNLNVIHSHTYYSKCLLNITSQNTHNTFEHNDGSVCCRVVIGLSPSPMSLSELQHRKK